MSIFFKALEQAERERALREQGSSLPGQSVPPAAADPAEPDQTPQNDELPQRTERGRRGARELDAPAPADVVVQTAVSAASAAPAEVAPPRVAPRRPARVETTTAARPADTATAAARVDMTPPAAIDVQPAAPRVTWPSREAAPAEPRPRVTPPSRTAVADLPVGEIDEHLVSLLQPMSPAAEQYRALRHVIDQLHRAEGLTVFAVCSPTVGDGKTTTAINLAATLAQSTEAQVLLLEADLRQPAIAERIGMSGSPGRGLVEALESPGLELDEIIRRRAPFDNLGVALAGRIAATPYEALESPRLAEFLEEARRRFDYVVVDTPPILSVPDCRVISKWVDGFVIVVAAHRTPRKMLEEALNVMEPSKVIGLVFTRDDHSASSYYAYGTYGTRPNRASVAAFAMGSRQ